jgi:hypothetical protein
MQDPVNRRHRARAGSLDDRSVGLEKPGVSNTMPRQSEYPVVA